MSEGGLDDEEGFPNKEDENDNQTFRSADPEEGRRLLRAFMRIGSREKREEILRQIEALAND